MPVQGFMQLAFDFCQFYPCGVARILELFGELLSLGKLRLEEFYLIVGLFQLTVIQGVLEALKLHLLGIMSGLKLFYLKLALGNFSLQEQASSGIIFPQF